MNAADRPSPTARNPKQQPNWGKLALYIALFLVMAWLYESQPADVKTDGQQEPPPSTSRDDRPSSRNPPTDRDATRARPDRVSQPPARVENAPDSESRGPDDRPAAGNATAIVHNARVTDEDGRVIYRGDVNLEPTLDRIQRGKRLRFSHDGIVFENRERRLPQKPTGYYHEFVHPTPDDDGPGGQRVVVGREGEVYYTPDHYHSFRRVQ